MISNPRTSSLETPLAHRRIYYTSLTSTLHIAIGIPAPASTSPFTTAYHLSEPTHSHRSTLTSATNSAVETTWSLSRTCWSTFCADHYRGSRVKTTRIRRSTILHIKQSTSGDELCKTFPSEFLQFLDYSRKLAFTEKPDYGRFQSCFQDLRVKLGGTETFDWQMLPDLSRRSVKRTVPDSKVRAPNRYISLLY